MDVVHKRGIMKVGLKVNEHECSVNYLCATVSNKNHTVNDPPVVYE